MCSSDLATGSVEEMRNTFKENKNFATNDALHVNHQTRRVSDSSVATNEKSYADLNSGSGNTGSTAAPLSATLDLTKKENAAHVISSSNTTVAYSNAAGALALTVKGQDPHVTIVYDGAISADKYKTLEITYMLPTTNSAGNNITDLFLCAGSITNPDASASVRVTNTPDGEYHTLVIDLSDKSFWKGDVNKLRLDYLDGCAAGDVMYVKSIVFK